MSIVEGLSVNIREWVVVGRADVGILYNASPSPAVELRPLLDEQLCLVSRRTLAQGRGAREAARPARTIR